MAIAMASETNCFTLSFQKFYSKDRHRSHISAQYIGLICGANELSTRFESSFKILFVFIRKMTKRLTHSSPQPFDSFV